MKRQVAFGQCGFCPVERLWGARGDSRWKTDSSGLKALGMTRAETLQNGLGLCGAKSCGSKPHADSNSYDV